jgi:putative membrane protein
METAMRWNTSTFHGVPRRNSLIAFLLVAAAVIAVLATRVNAQAPETLTDAQIVAIFDLANTADIETGRLGAARAQTKDVRDYATMLHQVHTQVRQNGRDLAKKLGVTPVLPKDDKSADTHAAVMSELRGLQGAEFDRAFLEHERAFHAAVLDAVKSTLLPAIRNQELKDFVVSLAPAFEAHLLAAENLQKKLASK